MSPNRSNAELHEFVHHELRPIRIRFWIIMFGLIAGSMLGVYLIQQTGNDDAARALRLQQALARQQHTFQVDSWHRCHQANTSRAGTRQVFREILALSTSGPHTPAKTAQIMRFIKETDEIIRTRIPDIECGSRPRTIQGSTG